jgi:protein-S-isoprenylcysteine O-methyltransferase Ste14
VAGSARLGAGAVVRRVERLLAVAVPPAAVLLVLWGAIRPEERFLRERFGAPYDNYTRRVRRWL